MIRVHGDIKIGRRKGMKYKSSYNSFKKELQEDFNFLCGYCGKSSKCFKEDYQIDHFIPKSLEVSRKGDYYNLVNSCRQCNRNKWNKWPTNNVEICHDGKVGFVDPVSDEFDSHLKREKMGRIIPLTEVGSYIVKELKLDIRQTDKVWTVMELEKSKNELKKIIKESGTNDKSKDLLLYFNLTDMLDKYLEYFYSRR